MEIKIGTPFTRQKFVYTCCRPAVVGTAFLVGNQICPYQYELPSIIFTIERIKCSFSRSQISFVLSALLTGAKT